MKLIRHGQIGQEKPGLQLDADGDHRIDASAFGQDFDEAFFADPANLERLKEWVDANADSAPRLAADVRLAPPVSRPGKIVCIGLNFSDHAEETGLEVPPEPIIFFKATTALCGPNDNLTIPKNATKTDWEVELAFVIGKKASYVEKENALDHVAGYVLHNDYSERAFQIERSGQWVKGKSCDTFAPLGPFIATQDEISDINNLRMWLTVNGESKQDGSTSTMVFDVPTIVSYLSQFMTLAPGDIVTTGTPPGVGMGMDPQQWIQDGDVIELGIDGLGSSKQTAVAWSE
ncbi:MAG: fumarylacetoacetate hydrolase family protein [Verrucomicrobiales bacterium]|nr:fumarylacetoacetate hydrolase family protein [Verrucomicrobiales bacterium]